MAIFTTVINDGSLNMPPGCVLKYTGILADGQLFSVYEQHGVIHLIVNDQEVKCGRLVSGSERADASQSLRSRLGRFWFPNPVMVEKGYQATVNDKPVTSWSFDFREPLGNGRS
ncbi:MAG: hypothetical protein A3J48_03455 [Candidatus Doudnabacteria bacterium RIFCSPHIGHO2_02_FULL_46_11]|uniref:Uncharacterized protein n=1 Tax=Candidatus Doudnabacteria bacterium RIFCSPHIGHO2_02_FULL_46_11 TaxID=1817832 RepID=A0A1F5P4T0_9BACT|nr:MAG: hypothetical protein A3J48_03455 [Candidatus Doudnabacteria bacterium RIFCSPHIGHO2_02_FULL_46_11]